MARTAIICLGNRYAAGDDIGLRVYDRLAGATLPEGMEVIDGGLLGLDLLQLMEGRRRVVFVDAVAGVTDIGSIVTLSQEQVAAYAGAYGHGAGLPYLLRMLPEVCEPPLPEITLVGVEGACDASAVCALTDRCIEVAVYGAS